MNRRDEIEVSEIRAFFEARNRSLRLSEHGCTWEAVIPAAQGQI